MPLVDS